MQTIALPLLPTKLYQPPPRPNAVARPQLIEQLNAGLYRRLTLISAPPGFGKTTLASQWLSLCSRPAAWLTLDPLDNESARLLTYLVAALQTIAPAVGAEVAALLQAPAVPPSEVLLPLLLKTLPILGPPAILVLDDYQVLDTPAIEQVMRFLVDHLPPHLHLVIVTREDPPLPLPRLRASDQLTELRAADLRFTSGEAASFLQQVFGLHLAPADSAALEERTEGWAVGLQLAALSMQGVQDLPGFIQAFAGNHRAILDYLVDEVLQRQSAEVRSFLLQTAILERVCGSLCEAVTGQHDGAAQLERLERGNFFLVPLDATRHWYRYQHLFGEALRARLQVEQPEQIHRLHQRASRWYEQQGATVEAIDHALAAADVARAADLIELALPALRQSRQEGRLLAWLKALPTELFHVRPVLSVGAAGAFLGAGELHHVEDRLCSAETWLAPDAEGRAQSDGAVVEMVVMDQAAFRQLPGAIALYRAGLALARGEVAATVTYASQALARIPAADHLLHGAATGLLGMASWTSGDLATAHESFTLGMASLQQAGHVADVLGLAGAVAEIQITQGQLHEALRTYQRQLPAATTAGAPLLRGTVDLYVGLSTIARERNDLSAATQHLLYAQSLGEHLGLAQAPYRWRVSMAQVKEAQGDLAGALDLLADAERRYVGDFFPQVQPIAARRARIWLAQGRLRDALGWVREQGLSAQDTLSYLREFAHITLARVLLAQAQADKAEQPLHDALTLLARLGQAAEAGGRTGSLIEILLVQALARQWQGQHSAALAALSRALVLAEPEGYVRTFLGAGPPLRPLLEMAVQQNCHPEYARRLLAASDQPAVGWFVGPDLIEPLSARELAVLRLLRTELSGPEIAHELVVSLNTLRTHTKHIYAKLGVHSRRAAVRQAQARGLY